MQRRLIAPIAGLACLIGACSNADQPMSQPTTLEVSGPLAQSEESHAFGGAAYTLRPQDLSADGYVEEEFLVSGTANVYDWPEPGPAVVRTPDVPYTTRVLVRRPASMIRSVPIVNLAWVRSGGVP